MFKCITICQPHAWAVCSIDRATGLQVKPYENRSKPWRHKGLLLIHAGKSREWLEDFPQYDGEPGESGLVFGAIIGAVVMVGCSHVDSVPFEHPTATGPYCLRFKGPVMFANPIPCRGQLGLWELPSRLEDEVRTQLEMAKVSA